jgi:hypothetical protein
MRLVAKFNLVLLVVFGLGFGAAALPSRVLLQRNAREERPRFLSELGVE